MSLTSEIYDKESPVAAFFKARLSNFDDFWEEWKAEVTPRPTIRPEEQIPWGTVGSALDYRLRYYYGTTPWNEFVAAIGASALTGVRELVLPNGKTTTLTRNDTTTGPSAKQRRWAGLVNEFVSRLDELISGVPTASRLEPDLEETLCRYCYVLALFEELYRAGTSVRSPLLLSVPKSVDDLVALASAAAVDDLRQLSWSFHATCADSFPRPFILNPTFDGSGEIGGADADIIVDGCLIDFKATVGPLKRSDVRPWTYQVLGYVLLDYSNRYRIKSVGIYLARQSLMLSWPLDELLARLTAGATPNLAEVRTDFREAVTASRRPIDREGSSKSGV